MLVLKVGGSVLFPNGPDVKKIRELAGIVKKLKNVAIVVGGGRYNAEYISALNKLGFPHSFNDIVGIDFSRMNARIIARAIGGTLVTDYDELTRVKKPVLGGMSPGQSTDAVAAVVAELTGGKLALIKDVGGVFTANPKTNKKAKLIKRMTYDELLKFANSESFGAKDYGVIDAHACKIIARSKIPTVICAIDKISQAFRGRAGTLIK